MKIKKSQLREIVRVIVKRTLKEYSILTPQPDSQNSLIDPNVNPSSPPESAMTSAEKAAQAREQEHEKQKLLKQKEQELKTAKKEMDFQHQKVDQSKRFTIPTINKDIQNLKGAKI